MSPKITRPTDGILQMFDSLPPQERLARALAYAHQAWIAHRWLASKPKGATIDGMTLEDVNDILEYWIWRERYAIAAIPTGRDHE